MMQPIREGSGVRPKLAYMRLSEPQVFEALTERQAEILHRVADGLSYAEIAQGLCITEKTVRDHMIHVIARLGVRNRHEAVMRACRLGLLPTRLEPQTPQEALQLAQHYIALAAKMMGDG